MICVVSGSPIEQRKGKKSMKYEDHFNTCNIKRKFPEWAKVDRVINGLPIYNMNIFDNIMTFNQDNLEKTAM